MNKTVIIIGLISLALILCGCMDVKKHCKEQTQLDYNHCVVGLTS